MALLSEASRSQICAGVILVLVVIGVGVGLGVGFGSLGRFKIDQGPCEIVQVGEEQRNSDDYIGLIFTTCPSQAAYDTFTAAASKWSNVISENKIAGSTLGILGLEASLFCNFLETGIFLPSGFQLDHLVILVEVIDIDGPGGTLAAAAPCVFDENENFPVLAGMLFDSFDINNLLFEGSLDTVILHEMGHALGIGSLWPVRSQNGGAATSNNALLQAPIFSSFSVNPSNIPLFIGTNAVSEYQTLLTTADQDADVDSVPIEDGRTDGDFDDFNPAEDENSGRGSIDSHWKIETFDQELMVFAIAPGETYPMSRMTLQSLADLGYSVNLTKAEDYALPSSTENAKNRLRGEQKMFKLINDIPMQVNHVSLSTLHN